MTNNIFVSCFTFWALYKLYKQNLYLLLFMFFLVFVFFFFYSDLDKLNTKIGWNTTHPPPQTFWPDPDIVEGWNFAYSIMGIWINKI